MFAAEITKEELNALSLAQFDGKIHVIERQGVAETVAEQLKSHSILGFDTETRPSFTKGRKNHVALLQLANASDAFLFRLCKMDFPKNLLALLTDPNILKIGAAINNDIDNLKRSVKLKPKGFIDLQELVLQYEIKNISLSKMAGIVLGVRITKSQQLSNWENKTLTPAQQRYAATDAWMCYMIYNKLREMDN